MFIYKITNNITNRSYVGQTKRQLEKRLKSHFYEARVKKYNMYLHNSIRKYGEEAFRIELIETCTTTNYADRERFWIKSLNTLQPFGYNEHEGGKGGCLNASPELRKKLSDAKKGKSPWNKGLTKCDPRVAKNGQSISKSSIGKPKSKSHKEAITRAKSRRRCLLTEDTSQTSE